MGDGVPPSIEPAPAPLLPCRNHADRATEAVCGRCADLICGLCAVWSDGVPYCPDCIVRVRALDLARPDGYIPWEDRERLGTATAAWRTVKAAFGDGRALYDTMPVSGGLADPLLFGMLMRAIVVVAYGVVFGLLYLILGAATGDPAMLMNAGVQVVSIVFQIVQAALILFLGAGLVHFGVRLFAGEGGFEATFRVYAYGRGLDVLELIPVAGPLVTLFWRVYVYSYGIRRVHRLEPRRALFAASIPLLLMLFFTFFVVGIAVVIALLLVASL